jgi:hypothetical protein
LDWTQPQWQLHSLQLQAPFSHPQVQFVQALVLAFLAFFALDMVFSFFCSARYRVHRG